jgi:hypothetical protein
VNFVQTKCLAIQAKFKRVQDDHAGDGQAKGSNEDRCWRSPSARGSEVPTIHCSDCLAPAFRAIDSRKKKAEVDMACAQN